MALGPLSGIALGGPRRDAAEARTPDLLTCAQLPDQSYAIVAIAKRTYTLRVEGVPAPRLELADEQVPVRVLMDLDLQTDELRDDADALPPKPATDVVIRGSAHAIEPAKEVMIAVAVGNVARQLRAVGERRVEIRADGRPSFTSPEPFTSFELGDAVAYGGYDEYAQDVLDPVTAELLAQWQRKPAGLYQYPRNPVGRAYFVDVDRERAHGARLPRVEDPGDALTPERLFVPTAMQWIDAPIPGRLGWVHVARYPRLGRVAQALLQHADPTRPIRETTFADGQDLQGLRDVKWPRPMARVLQGASPGLACERLRGDELVILKHLHPRLAELRFSLPAESPKISLRPAGLKALTPAAVLNTLRIEPDLGRVSLTWCAAVPAASFVPEDQLAGFAFEVSWSRLG